MSTAEAPHVPESGSRVRPAHPPRWLTVLTVAWLTGYIAMRLGLTTVDVPMSAMGPDLVMLTGLPGVGVLMIALLAVGAQSALPRRQPTPVPRLVVSAAGAVTAATLMGAAALILIDLVSGVLPGLGMGFYPLGVLSRLGCVVAASLVSLHTWHFWKSTRGGDNDRPRPQRTAGWVVAVGYITVAACLVRVAAQLVVGMDTNPLSGGASMIVFEAGFLLAGILLPLALVHRWGRIWPEWVPLLRGRRVPRHLLIVCGSVLGVTMVAYFGVMTGQMVFERLQGRTPFPPSGGLDLPEAFFWVSVPAYVVWGIGLLIGTVSYARITTPKPSQPGWD